MASYHCTVKSGGKGRAGPHADYIEREGKYSPELTQGKSKLEDLEYKASGNMPKWAEHSAGIFWRAADEHERANGATYREIEIALPRELNPDQRRALVEDFIQQQIGDRHAFTFAIHIPKAAIEKGDQPHCHLMYSERTLDGIDRDPEQYFKRANTKNPEKGGCKKDSAGTKERLLATRELWAKVQNAHLEKAGCEDRVSHLSLKARGIDRAPEKHLGTADAKKIDAPALVESRGAERELEQARAGLSKIDITAALEQAQREAAEQQAQAQAKVAAALACLATQHEAQDLEVATLAKQEKENDRIRAAAIASINSNVEAAGRASAATDKSIGAGRAAGIEAKRDLFGSEKHLIASREHLDAVQGVTRGIERNLESAAKGAERRQLARNLDRCAPAVAKQLGNVERVIREVGRIFGNVVRTIAAACQLAAAYTQAKREIQAERQSDSQRLEELITLRVADRKAKEVAAKASERPQQAAKSQVNADEEKQPKPARHPEIDRITFHTAEDKGLAERTKALYLSTTPPGEAQRQQLAIDIQAAIIDAVATSRATEPKTNPVSIDRDVRAEHNAEAARAGQIVPWPPGQGSCALHVAASNAKLELEAHQQSGRPLMFGRKEHDDKTADLASKHKAIQDAAKAAEARLASEVAQRVEAVRQRDAQNASKHEQAELRIDSLKELEKIATRERSVVRAGETQKQSKTHNTKTKLPTLPMPLAQLPRAPAKSRNGGTSR